jgi:uncharacterized protein YecE (DUF72 family)
MSGAGPIRVGIGGLDYDPWRETFYPKGLAKAKQLNHVGKTFGITEINATFYKLQKQELFERWAADVPDGFMFAIKGSRFCTNRKDLASAGESIEKFLGQGLHALGPKLGPILWQFAATKKFDEAEAAGFLDLLPPEVEGVRLRHVVEAAHESFRDPRFIDLASAKNVALCYVDDDGQIPFEDQTADFSYARFKAAQSDEPAGYPPATLDTFAAQAKDWAKDGRPVFLFAINGAKERAPAAALALMERLGLTALD